MARLTAFFRKRPQTTANDSTSQQNNTYYNTYLFYYCGPTSPLTDSLAFVDGSELSLEEIISIWKQIHCVPPLSAASSPPTAAAGVQTSSDEETVAPPPPPHKPTPPNVAFR